MAWNDVDKRCEKCGQVTERAKGFNKQNLKRLIRPFPQNQSEWTVLICLVLIILVMYAYREDTKVCREYVKEVEARWAAEESFRNMTQGNPYSNTRYPNLTFTLVIKNLTKNETG